ncbi:hypothetical protein [Yimella lutea]|uniref:hypothetical protein n=1 Tax=Yimella lutea TaxID=587872 RepID=UPI001FE6BA18|nr:hypothetical protein [Yimella lutea]
MTPDVADSVEAAGAELVVDVVWLVGVADSLVLVEADAETGSDEDEVEGAAVEAGGVVVAVVVEDTAASDVSFAGATIDPMTPMRTNKPTTAPATIAIGCFHHGRFLGAGPGSESHAGAGRVGMGCVWLTPCGSAPTGLV